MEEGKIWYEGCVDDAGDEKSLEISTFEKSDIVITVSRKRHENEQFDEEYAHFIFRINQKSDLDVKRYEKWQKDDNIKLIELTPQEFMKKVFGDGLIDWLEEVLEEAE